MIVKYVFGAGTALVKAAGNHSSGGEATGEKRPATEPQTRDLRASNAEF